MSTTSTTTTTTTAERVMEPEQMTNEQITKEIEEINTKIKGTFETKEEESALMEILKERRGKLRVEQGEKRQRKGDGWSSNGKCTGFGRTA